MGKQRTENIRPIQAAILEDLITWAAAADREDREWYHAYVDALKRAASEVCGPERRSDLCVLWRRWYMRAEAGPIGGVDYTAWHFAAGALEMQLGSNAISKTERVGGA